MLVSQVPGTEPKLNTVAKHFMTKAKYDTLIVVLGEF